MWEAAEESFYLFSRRVPGTTRVSLMLLKTSTYDVRLLARRKFFPVSRRVPGTTRLLKTFFFDCFFVDEIVPRTQRL